MKTLTVLLLWSAVTLSSLHAAESFRDVNEPLAQFTYEKRVFTNAVVVKAGTEQGIVRIGEGALVRVSLKDLPEPTRSKVYDPAKAAEVQRLKQAQEDARKSNYTARVLQSRETFKTTHMRYSGDSLENIEEWPELKGEVRRRVQDGLLIQLEVVTKKSFVEMPELSGRQRAGAYSRQRAFTYDKCYTNWGPHVLLTNHPRWTNFATGDRVNLNAKRVGTRDLGTIVVDVYDYGRPYESQSTSKQ